MPVWAAALGLSVVGSVGALLTASLLLLFHQDIRAKAVPWLVSYAVGALLGAAVLSLVPEAFESQTPARVLPWLLVGIITFFILEKLALWRHCHDDQSCAVHKSTVALVILGDAVHTFVDGAVIAAASLVSLTLGVTTALAIVAHEIPHQAGDIAILLAAGYSRSRALLLNLTSAIGGVVGAGAMLLFGEKIPNTVPFVIAFAAGNFLYVAMSDLIPNLHRGHLDQNAVRQVVLIVLGIMTIVAL